MSSNSKQAWDDIDITRDELEQVTQAFKNDEFKKMFFDYCEEIQDPENKKKYEDDIIRLEAERGVDVTFLHPEPGFVVKTSIDGQKKAFINISQCENIEKPKGENAPGKSGTHWAIPMAQAPPRRDFDNKGKDCTVYDVLFHPDALRLASNDVAFKKHLIDTACDAVEREFKVKLDRTNLKYPKLKFKGIPRPIVVRKMSKKPPTEKYEPSPIDAFYPPLPKEDSNSKPKVFHSQGTKVVTEYATPLYVIKHRKGVDMSEMTYELDAKLNVTIPKELIVEVELPLLKSTANCNLDVTERRLFLCSEKPAKYKLCIDLPYPVNDKDGTARFDQTTRKLTIALPVRTDKERTLKDLYREDSGVESDVKEENSCHSPDNVSNPLIEELNSEEEPTFKELDTQAAENEQKNPDDFLDNTINYNFPSGFDCNTLDENLAFTLHIKNADPDSLEYRKSEKFAHLKFSSIGSGYYPIHYAFYVSLPAESETIITSVEAEAWDNNVILTLSLKNYKNLHEYFAGLKASDVRSYEITEPFLVTSRRFSQALEKDEIEIKVTPSEEEIQINISPKIDNIAQKNKENKEKDKDSKKLGGNGSKKQQKKKNKKQRSFSDSSYEDGNIGAELEIDSTSPDCSNNSPDDESLLQMHARKSRSFSESRDSISMDGIPSCKSILKRRSRYGRSNSESCSSFEELPGFSLSLDLPVAESFTSIPEEPQEEGLSESVKKTVRFSDVIRKQLFRLDSSILGQRKKNQKRRNQKQRALQRRNSEGDSTDYYDKAPRPQPFLQRKNKITSQHDSGLDLSEVGSERKGERGLARGRIGSDSSDLESKSALMFDMEV